MDRDKWRILLIEAPYSFKLLKQNLTSEVVQLEAVKQDGLSIQFIRNPSEAVQLEAVKQDWLAIRYIHNPSEAVMLVYLGSCGIYNLLCDPSYDFKSPSEEPEKE